MLCVGGTSWTRRVSSGHHRARIRPCLLHPERSKKEGRNEVCRRRKFSKSNQKKQFRISFLHLLTFFQDNRHLGWRCDNYHNLAAVWQRFPCLAPKIWEESLALTSIRSEHNLTSEMWKESHPTGTATGSIRLVAQLLVLFALLFPQSPVTLSFAASIFLSGLGNSLPPNLQPPHFPDPLS